MAGRRSAAVEERRDKLASLLRGIEDYRRLVARAKYRKASQAAEAGAIGKPDPAEKEARTASEQAEETTSEGGDVIRDDVDATEATDNSRRRGERNLGCALTALRTKLLTE